MAYRIHSVAYIPERFCSADGPLHCRPAVPHDRGPAGLWSLGPTRPAGQLSHAPSVLWAHGPLVPRITLFRFPRTSPIGHLMKNGIHFVYIYHHINPEVGLVNTLVGGGHPLPQPPFLAASVSLLGGIQPPQTTPFPVGLWPPKCKNS